MWNYKVDANKKLAKRLVVHNTFFKCFYVGMCRIWNIILKLLYKGWNLEFRRNLVFEAHLMLNYACKACRTCINPLIKFSLIKIAISTLRLSVLISTIYGNRCLYHSFQQMGQCIVLALDCPASPELKTLILNLVQNVYVYISTYQVQKHRPLFITYIHTYNHAYIPK